MKDFYKKNKNTVIGVLIGIIIVVVIAIFIIIVMDENALTIDEKTWIDENVSSVLNVNIINDSNIFGSSASGVYYDFLSDFSDEYDLSINPVTYKYENEVSGLTLGVFDELGEDDVIFYSDHYVLLAKEYEIVNSYDDINDVTAGVLSKTVESIEKSFTGNLEEYSSEDDLISAFSNGDVDYIIVPRYIFADYILENDYSVIYHLSDVEYFYGIKVDDSELSSVMKKFYYSTWEDEMYESFKENELDLYVESLGLTESQTDKISSIDYTYGFVENSPYEVISSGSFGGVSAVLISEFSDFANVEFEFVKFSSYDDLLESVDNNEIDVYFDKYNFTSDYDVSLYGYNPIYYIIAPRDNSIVINSISGLAGKDVYVEANTKLYDYLSNYSDINLLTYSSEDELFKLNKLDVIIILDSNSYEFYATSDLDNYTNRYSFTTDFTNGYAVSTDDILFTLLDEYMNLADDNKLIIEGINNHYNTISIGNLLASLAKYILLALIVLLFVMIVFIQKSKKIQIARKIKKDDKLKYIDQLTSLKNRNYFNDSKEAWDNNTIYPQAVIIVDLNKIQKLNDQFGYKEGDKQIKAFANALIKTQLDNTEIMRTDGNEFMVYLVGYEQKQIVNYIHKLNKEVDKLPHGDGAKFGYSIIESNLKTVEDALSEAENDMIEKNKDE